MQPCREVPFGGGGIGVLRTRGGMQNEPDDVWPCGQGPPGPGGFGCGRSCASASDGSRKAMMATINFIV